ncbi:hypothetical protein EJB05_37029, partial [Eragrostis curvula]
MRPAAAEIGGEDRISALPDDVLHLLLSSLPSDEAVRTSVLARRWRHLWKSARAIRVAPRRRGHAAVRWTPRSLTRFVNHLLLLRGYSPAADECDIHCGELDDDGDDEDLSDAAGLWIRHAVSFCKCRVLRFSVRTGNRLHIPDVPFVSQSLTKFELTDAKLAFGTLDFSGCPALEAVDFTTCRINLGRILSPSLRRLSMDDCNFTGKTRTCISTPLLVSLHVTVCSGWAPFLDDMPILFSGRIATPALPLLNEWCMTPDFGALVYFLRYTPVLEKLTLQLEYCEDRRAVAVKDEEYSPKEEFLYYQKSMMEKSRWVWSSTEARKVTLGAGAPRRHGSTRTVVAIGLVFADDADLLIDMRSECREASRT